MFYQCHQPENFQLLTFRQILRQETRHEPFVSKLRLDLKLKMRDCLALVFDKVNPSGVFTVFNDASFHVNSSFHFLAQKSVYHLDNWLLKHLSCIQTHHTTKFLLGKDRFAVDIHKLLGADLPKPQKYLDFLA